MINKIRIFYNNNSIWIYLSKYIFISLIIAVGVILIDTQFILVLDYIPNIFLTSVSLAKVILSTLAGSLLTITTFTFSTIMIVITTYSSQFSPRVVNNFLTDKITMKVLGIFIGGFFYCILALFFMRNSFSQHLVLSATIAVIYSILCIIYFVIFVYKVASSIQATKLISRLYDEAWESIANSSMGRNNQIILDEYKIDDFQHIFNIYSDRNGYLELVEFKSILRILKDINSSLVLQVDIGAFISKKEKICTLYYNGELEEGFQYELLKEFSVEEERTAYNDYRFSLKKIVDITLRAISPGINDPNTAVHCINILGVLLSRLGEITGKYIMIKKDNSKSKIIYQDFNFNEDLYFTFYQIVNYGKHDISIVLAILNALKTINLSSSADKKPAIEEFSQYIYTNSIHNFTHPLDLNILDHAIKAIGL